MRISDWSSDVCSSDLELCQAGRSGHAPEASADHHCARHALNPSGCPATVRAGEVRRERSGGTAGARVPSLPPSPGLPAQADRKSGVSGKWGRVREAPGGRMIHKKKKMNERMKT